MSKIKFRQNYFVVTPSNGVNIERGDLLTVKVEETVTITIQAPWDVAP